MALFVPVQTKMKAMYYLKYIKEASLSDVWQAGIASFVSWFIVCRLFGDKFVGLCWANYEMTMKSSTYVWANYEMTMKSSHPCRTVVSRPIWIMCSHFTKFFIFVAIWDSTSNNILEFCLTKWNTYMVHPGLAVSEEY